MLPQTFLIVYTPRLRSQNATLLRTYLPLPLPLKTMLNLLKSHLQGKMFNLLLVKLVLLDPLPVDLQDPLLVSIVLMYVARILMIFVLYSEPTSSKV